MGKEIQQLTEQLTEETGRGGGFIFESGDEADDA